MNKIIIDNPAKSPHVVAYHWALKRFLEPLISVVNIRYIGVKAVLGIFFKWATTF